MDFIERYFGFSPDNGDGSFEAMLLIVLVTIITGISLGFFGKHHVCNGGDQPLEVLLLVALVTFIAVVGLRLLGIGKTKDGVRKKTRNRYFRGL